MYSIEIRHLYTLQSDHLSKTSIHLIPYIVITILLTIFPYAVLYIPMADYLYNWHFVFLSSVNLFHSSPNPPTIWQQLIHFLHLWVCFCLYFIVVLFTFPWWLVIEHLYICLLTICMSSLEKCLFMPCVHFLIGFLVLLVLYEFLIDVGY